MSFMISPTKLEESKENNYPSNPLASNRLRMLPTSHEDDDDDSQIQFATGEILSTTLRKSSPDFLRQ